MLNFLQILGNIVIFQRCSEGKFRSLQWRQGDPGQGFGLLDIVPTHDFLDLVNVPIPSMREI